MSQFIALLERYHQQLEAKYGALLNQDIRRAIFDMLHCKSDATRVSQWHCRHCQHDQQHPASCGNRNCPQCLHQTTSNWLAKQTDKLLPVHYFMVTFTLSIQSTCSTTPQSALSIDVSSHINFIKRLCNTTEQRKLRFY